MSMSSSVQATGIYRDYYNVDLQQVKAEHNISSDKCKGPRGGVAIPFPVKLYAMLEGAKKEGWEHIVSWQAHGRCFMVHEPKQFVADVLPRAFNQSKMSSFQRQLNLYGFQIVADGIDRGGYYHELFLLGRPDIAKIMLRTRVKVTLNSEKINSWGGDAPDFYKYPFCKESTKEPTVVPYSKESSDESSDDSITAGSQTWDTSEGSFSRLKAAVRVSPRESPPISNFANKGRALPGSSWNGPSDRLNFVLKPLPRAPRLITPSAVSLSKKVFGHSLAQFEGQTFQCIDNCSLAAMESILISEDLLF